MIALRTNGCKNYDGCDDCLEANRLETIREEIQAMQERADTHARRCDEPGLCPGHTFYLYAIEELEALEKELSWSR